MYGNIRAVYGPNRVNLGWEIGLINFFALFLHPIEVVTKITLDHDTFNLYYVLYVDKGQVIERGLGNSFHVVQEG